MAINPNSTVIAVCGGKGGVGKSVFAANFACALMTELRAPVLLIDADSKSVGDQNVITGLKPQKTLRELVNFQGSLNSTPLNTLITPHPSGLHYVGAVRGPEERMDANPELIGRLLEFFSKQYRFIVIDIGNDLGPFQMNVIQESTAIMVVTAPEILVITQTQRLINDLLSATIPKDMIQLVINKASATGINPQAIAGQLQFPPVGIIPQDDATSFAALQRFTPFVLSNAKAPVSAAYFDVVRRLTGGVLQRLKSLSKPKPAATVANNATSNGNANTTASGIDQFTMSKLRVHDELIRTVDLTKLLADSKDESKEKEIREKVKREITLIVDREFPDAARDYRSKVIDQVLKESLGLGPLEDLLANPEVSEIMINGPKKIFIELSGKIQTSDTVFTSEDHLRRVIERIVTPLGRQVNESSPLVDARLKDGSRVNAVIPPIALDGSTVTIRKFKKGGISPEKYIGFGTMTKNMIDFIELCVEHGMNVVISGGTGSGKTSLLNMMSSFIPNDERIVTVEDAAELQLQQDHVVRLETRPATSAGGNPITIRDLIKNALRMRPDRIVVGETRDGAALDMLQAMNTGHDGSMTTTHANSPRECIARLETLCLMAGMDLPMKAIREQISSAVHLIVQISRLSDGSRKIMNITEVQGMQGGDLVTLADIFVFKETGFDKTTQKITGQFVAKGTIPNIIQKLSEKGIEVDRSMFSNEPAPSTPPSTKPSNQPPGTPGVKPGFTPPGLKKTS